jgi:hypothetical protein
MVEGAPAQSGRDVTMAAATGWAALKKPTSVNAEPGSRSGSFISGCDTNPGMDRKRLQRELEEAERELDAATRLSDVKAAAARLQRAKAELALLDAEPPGRSERATSHGRGPASS